VTRVPRTKPTCLLHTWRPHRRRPFALVLHLHQHKSSRNPHLQYLAKNQPTQRCQSLITQGSDHPPVLQPHMVLNFILTLGDLCHGHPQRRFFTSLQMPLAVLLNSQTGIVSPTPSPNCGASIGFPSGPVWPVDQPIYRHHWCRRRDASSPRGASAAAW
jgi:hypothetical protein